MISTTPNCVDFNVSFSKNELLSSSGLVTSWSLAVLSFERYLVICKPFGAFKFSSNHALAAVAVTWFMGVSCAIPPFFGWSR